MAGAVSNMASSQSDSLSLHGNLGGTLTDRHVTNLLIDGVAQGEE